MYMNSMPIFQNYLVYVLLILTLTIIAISISIKKSYCWFILNQALIQLHFQIEYILSAHGIMVVDYLGDFGNVLVNTMHSDGPYYSLILLVLTRYLGLYFPNKFDKFISGKGVIFTILFWNILCLLPFIVKYYYFLFSSFRDCPHFTSNICENTTKYYFYL